jgi:drug/metabolite transporter (DMT)-like permease
MVGATALTVAVATAPFAELDAPGHLPSLAATGSLLALGVLCTGLAFVIFYSLVASDGPAKASLVGYIAPGFSIAYGITLLDERFTVATAAGLVLILGGTWLAATGGQLPAGGVDVAAAGEPHGGADAPLLEGGPKGGNRVAA